MNNRTTVTSTTTGRLMAASLLLMTVTLLTGCVSTQWVKAGTSDQDRKHQLTACEAQALKDLPPDNVPEARDSTSTGRKKDKKVQADTRTDYQVRDENSYPRETIVKDCMYQHGWEQIRLQQ